MCVCVCDGVRVCVCLFITPSLHIPIHTQYVLLCDDEVNERGGVMKATCSYISTPPATTQTVHIILDVHAS